MLVYLNYIWVVWLIPGLPRIIHRDIKAANILIDNNYEAMVYINSLYLYI